MPEVTPADFYDPAHRKIFEAIRRLYEERKPIDFVSVAEELRGEQSVEAIGGSAFLATLASDVPTSAHAAHYATIVRGKATLRQLINAGAAISTLSREPDVTADEA